jgi:hypothetical protein
MSGRGRSKRYRYGGALKTVKNVDRQRQIESDPNDAPPRTSKVARRPPRGKEGSNDAPPRSTVARRQVPVQLELRWCWNQQI